MPLSFCEFWRLSELTDHSDIARGKRSGDHQKRDEGIV
jgi:hypothetical protein